MKARAGSTHRGETAATTTAGRAHRGQATMAGKTHRGETAAATTLVMKARARKTHRGETATTTTAGKAHRGQATMAGKTHCGEAATTTTMVMKAHAGAAGHRSEAGALADMATDGKAHGGKARATTAGQQQRQRHGQTTRTTTTTTTAAQMREQCALFVGSITVVGLLKRRDGTLALVVAEHVVARTNTHDPKPCETMLRNS